MALPNVSEVKECPYCGSDEGFHITHTVSGHAYTHYTFDGSESCNSEMYSGINHHTHKYATCSKCDKRIGVWNSESLKAVNERAKGYSFTR